MTGMFSAWVPELASLQLLLAVQSTGSLGAAGKAVGITQQAASARIRTMEGQIGVPLLTRSRRGSTLSPAGTLIAQWAVPVVDAVSRLDAGIASLRHDRDIHLRVAASLTIAEHLAPRWFLALRAGQLAAGTEPTTVELTAVNSDAVLDEVRTGTVDLGFIESAGTPRGVHSRVVAHDRLVLVVEPSHKWARRSKPITAAELAVTPLVSREVGSGTRDALDRALRAALPSGVELARPALELTSTAAVRAAIAAGTAPAALSELAVADDLTLGRLRAVPIADVDLSRKLRAVWSSGPHPPAGPARDLVAIAARS